MHAAAVRNVFALIIPFVPAVTNARSMCCPRRRPIRFTPGVVPPEWVEWLRDNLSAGVPSTVVLKKLHHKGFFPCVIVLMLLLLLMMVLLLCGRSCA